jgi:hypothetical protein
VKYGSESARELLNFRIFEEFPEIQRIIMKFIFVLSADSLNYIFYLDNLFTFLPLAKALKEISINIIKITRKNIKNTYALIITYIKEKE